ncbi:suppressor protein SRP40-like [Nymphaea colorata]|nr:suppressor protein SRP40-like [Nymphaea colorata]
MKQRLVLSFSEAYYDDYNSRSKAMKIVGGANGVTLVKLDEKDESKLVVIGEEMDAYGLLNILKKKNFKAHMESLEEIRHETKENHEKYKKKEHHKKEEERKHEKDKKEKKKKGKDKKKHGHSDSDSDSDSGSSSSSDSEKKKRGHNHNRSSSSSSSGSDSDKKKRGHHHNRSSSSSSSSSDSDSDKKKGEHHRNRTTTTYIYRPEYPPQIYPAPASYDNAYNYKYPGASRYSEGYNQDNCSIM